MSTDCRITLALLLMVGLLPVAISGCGKSDAKTAASQVGDKKNKRPAKSNREIARTRSTQSGIVVARKSKTNRQTIVQSKTPVATAKKQSAKKPQEVFRPSDNRPRHDDALLAKVGIKKYVSKRLILYTDIDEKIASKLPAYIDAAYEAWVAYFGKLPPTRERAEFQVTGYIMSDKPLFERAGLLPVDLPSFAAGRHRGYRFWMFAQKTDYYRRHLMIHEATHCFMYALRDGRFAPWYMEGMAEFFGTHWTDDKGVTHFGVMPANRREFGDFGRIEIVQDDVRDGKAMSLADVLRFRSDNFSHPQQPRGYAWSWAMCKFLAGHPKYSKRFRELGRVLTPTRFDYEIHRWMKSQQPQLPTEWTLYLQGIDYGFDLPRAAIDVVEGQSLAIGAAAKTTDLATNRGWQSSNVRVEKGRTYRVTATGKFIIAKTPKPWVCEPQGVSIFYVGGRPLGMVTAMIWPDSPTIDLSRRTAPAVISIGRGHEFIAAETGTLYFRVNDFWSQIADNTGSLKLRTEAVKE